MSSGLAIGLEDVLAARERLRRQVYYSPCARSEMLSRLTAEEAKRGVVAASAGNHAQGVAYHATRLGVRSIIVMPLATPLVKVTATREFGAEVILHGANYDEACTEATKLCEAEGMTFIHPFDDPLVMAGQGTIGLELLQQIEGL